MSVLTDTRALVTALVEAAAAHLLIATILCAGLIAVTFFIRDPRVRRATSLAALLVFLVPLPDLLPDRGIQTLHLPLFTFDATASQISATAAHPSTSFDPIVAIGLLWITVAGVLILRTLLSFRDRRTELRDLSDGLTERLGVPPNVPVRVSAGSEGPLVTGLFRPAIIVPAQLLDPEREDELRAVLLHELAHVRQRDNLWGAAAALVTSVFWFHPLTWLAALRFRASSEVACDAAVIEAGVTLTTYLESLRKVIADAPYERTARVALGGGSLKERIRIMKSSTSPMSRHAARAVIIMIAIVTLGTGLSLRAMTGDEPKALQLPGDSENVSAYRVESQIVPLEDGTLQADFVVIHLNPMRVLSMPSIRFAAGEPAVIMTGQQGDDGMQLKIELTPSPTGTSYDARLELERGTERFEKQLSIEADEQSSPAPPIDLTLEDAKLADVLDLFSKLLNAELVIAAEIDHELVTVNLKKTPWDQALDEVLQPSGLDWRKVANLLVVAGPGEGAIRPQTPRKPTVNAASASDPRVQPPVVLERAQPEYPMEAREAGLEGSVVLELTVGEDGVLQNVRVKRPLEMGLTEAAVEAVRKWKFSPATIEGKAVPFIYHVQIRFGLSDRVDGVTN